MKFVKIAAAAAVALLVAACLFSPGKFEAGMTVMKDGRFTYRYAGEILLLTGHSMMSAASEAEMAGERFDPDTQFCWTEGGGGDGDADAPAMFAPAPVSTTAPPRIEVPVPVIRSAPSGDGRECTPEEIEAKRREWEAGRAERRASKERETATVKAMLGGIDPTDPATMTEFARRLQGQGGWKKVVHKGDGLFEVEYEISGRLDHDFVFPVFDGVDFIVPFVQATQRSGSRIHVVAPAFVKPGGDRMGMSSFGAAAMMGAGGGADKAWPFKSPEGTFTLTTDAQILTNNTREGPAGQGASKVLKWTISPLDTTKPEALLQL